MQEFNEMINSIYSNFDTFYFNNFTATIVLIIFVALSLLIIYALLFSINDLLEYKIELYKPFKKACRIHFKRFVNKIR